MDRERSKTLISRRRYFAIVVLVVLIMSIVTIVAVVSSSPSVTPNQSKDSLIGTRGRDRNVFDQPNIILMLADDMGVGDLSSYGHPTQEPGFVDQMAANGIRFTTGYVGDTICTPSRAAIMTGRLPVRVGMYSEDGGRIILPVSTVGLPKNETTIAEVLQQANYTTGMVGKWHLGINEKTNSDGAHLPYHHGFDFVGHNLPFTNSFYCDDTGIQFDFPDPGACFLYYNATVVAQPFQHRGLTQLFVNDSIEFIRENQDNPFFLYASFAHPHTSLFTHSDFACKSRRGRYGDNILEMQAAVGDIVHELEALNIDDNTVIFFISDHGPQLEGCREGGDPGIFRGGKTHAWEGGHRIPYIVYWPGTVQSRISNELVTSMDIIATAADLAGTTLPDDRVYDGRSIKDLILDEGAASPHDTFFYYCGSTVMAVRKAQYKAHYRTQRVLSREKYGEQCDEGVPFTHYFDCQACSGDCVTEHDPPIIYDLYKDPTESYPLNVSNYQEVYFDIEDALWEHEVMLVKGTPIIGDKNSAVAPCCDETTECICNYEQDPQIGSCYEYLLDIGDRSRVNRTA